MYTVNNLLDGKGFFIANKLIIPLPVTARPKPLQVNNNQPLCVDEFEVTNDSATKTYNWWRVIAPDTLSDTPTATQIKKEGLAIRLKNNPLVVPNELIGHSYDVRVSFETNKPSEGKWLSPQALIALGDKAFKKITRIEVKRHGNGESHWEDAKNRLKKRRFYN